MAKREQVALLARRLQSLLLQQPNTRQLVSVQSRGFASQDRPDVAVTSGAGDQGTNRTVTIFAPARTAAQQGLAATAESSNPAWRIAFDNQGKWINPLMGWTSTADPMENVHRQLYFDSKEAAVAFAEKNGWKYDVEDVVPRDNSRPKRFIGYGDNYSVKRKGVPKGGLRSELLAVGDAKAKPKKAAAKK
jgi:NADH dehydrogenase (ubiquinone) Fe-S protein 4